MFRKVLIGSCVVAAMNSVAPSLAFAEELDTLTERVSYVLGFNMGTNLKRDEVDIDIDILVRAVEEAMAGKTPALTEEEMKMAMQSLHEQLQARRAEMIRVASEKNLAEGEAFLAANARKDGVTTTESGLQYKVLEAGSGDKPGADDRVTVHYRGTLLDGTEFDSSYSRGQPATFGVKQVIPGWTEVLQLMPQGSKWEVYIPSDLAYGPAGTGANIGPNSTLVFEIELLETKTSSPN